MRTGVIPWILALFVLAGGARAQEDDAPPPSLDRILPRVRESHPGKFYDAEGPWRGPDGRYRYRLKWMTPNGRIIWFDADARTGRVLGPDFETRHPDAPRVREEERRFGPAGNDRSWKRGKNWPREERPHGGHFRRGR